MGGFIPCGVVSMRSRPLPRVASLWVAQRFSQPSHLSAPCIPGLLHAWDLG